LIRIPDIDQFIYQENYFVIHAPRQIDKTTAMMGLAQQITNSGEYIAALVSADR
jgi:hypothetical protein